MILKCNDSDLYDFTIGKRYICFGVQFNEYRNETKVSVRRDSDGTPVIVEISKFEIIKPSIPEGWEILLYKQEDTIILLLNLKNLVEHSGMTIMMEILKWKNYLKILI